MNWLISGTEAIRCYACENDSCARRHGYVETECGPGTYSCYNLQNVNKKTFQAGCLNRSCEDLKGKGPLQCEICDSNLCNAPTEFNSNYPSIGGGVTFNSAPGFSILGSLILLFLKFA